MNIREYLGNNTLLFDGAMGTYYKERTAFKGTCAELANDTERDLILEIHQNYLKAGAKAIKTNTFGISRSRFGGDEEATVKVLEQAFNTAREAAVPFSAYVFADIGPVGDGELFSPEEELVFQAECFARLGAKHFLFETNASLQGIVEAAEAIKQITPDAYIIASFAVQPDGFSQKGLHINSLYDRVLQCGMIDAFGLNCVSSARHMRDLLAQLPKGKLPISIMPNAGYPVVLGNKTYYDGSSEYFAVQLAEMTAEGAAIVGGCCGTTPEHIKKAAQAIHARPAVSVPVQAAAPKSVKWDNHISQSPFWNKLQQGKKVIAVELDPPFDSDLSKFMSGAWQLKSAGTDIITIADCPIGRARMDSSLLACKIRRELSIDALPHMTCRDRNLNASKGLLFGLHAEGIRNVLLVTGDPIPMADRDEVKSVFQFNSRLFAGYVAQLGKEMLSEPFHIFGALNLNAVNFDVQLKIAKQKLEAGMIGFLTQPIHTKTALENLIRARKELPAAYILAGIMPIVSERNARFMDSEVAGIKVAPEIIEQYAGKNRAEGEKLAAEISLAIMKSADAYCDGFYLITPFGRTALIAEILKLYKENDNSL